MLTAAANTSQPTLDDGVGVLARKRPRESFGFRSVWGQRPVLVSRLFRTANCAGTLNGRKISVFSQRAETVKF